MTARSESLWKRTSILPPAGAGGASRGRELR
jgi:hypothetical protein